MNFCKRERVATWLVIFSLALVGLLYFSSFHLLPGQNARASFYPLPRGENENAHASFYPLPQGENENAHASFNPLPQGENAHASSNKTSTPIHEDEQREALESASMENKTLIIAIVSKAYTEEGGMLDLFLQSFQLGEDTQFLLNHLLLVAVDQTAFDQCNRRHRYCYKLVTEGVDFSGEAFYMSSDYIKMTWTKILFAADVLRRGYNFIFTDADVLWLRNPFGRLGQGTEDLQFSCDFYNGSPSDQANPFNTGFYFVTSSNRTIALFDAWHAARNVFLGMNDQEVLQLFMRDGRVIRHLDLKVGFLDPLYFGGFCSSSRDYGKIVTIHANCCCTIRAKSKDLRAVLAGWAEFRGPSNRTSTVEWPSYSACFPSLATAPGPN